MCRESWMWCSNIEKAFIYMRVTNLVLLRHGAHLNVKNRHAYSTYTNKMVTTL